MTVEWRVLILMPLEKHEVNQDVQMYQLDLEEKVQVIVQVQEKSVQFRLPTVEKDHSRLEGYQCAQKYQPFSELHPKRKDLRKRKGQRSKEGRENQLGMKESQRDAQR